MTEKRWTVGTNYLKVKIIMAKIYIFSGEDIVSSRNAYIDQIEFLKKQKQEIGHIPAKEINDELVESVFGGSSLFGLSRAIATEKFFSGQKSKTKDQTLEKILSFPQAVLIDWEEKEFTKAAINKPRGVFIVKNFALPKILWKFLDELSPENKTQNLQALHKIILSLEPHFIFSMIIRQFRLLILTIDGEADNLASWQKNKLAGQATKFGREKLIRVYRTLLEIDIKQKTSSSPFDLNSELDLLILGL